MDRNHINYYIQIITSFPALLLYLSLKILSDSKAVHGAKKAGELSQ